MPKYVDHGLYASHAASPTWGAAQDGDGSAIGAATSATVSIDLSAATAAAGATFVIMGATLTCVASAAAANQFNAGAGATLVANLVTAINRSTNTRTCIAAPHNGTSWTTPKVQDTVFARIGTPTTTLQIMTRAGSADYNAVGTISTSGLTGGTFGPYTFSGGVSGAWGWLFNPSATAFGSAIAVMGYGVWEQQKPIAGAIAAGDLVNIRSNKTVTLLSASLYTINLSAMGSPDSPVKFVIDDSTVWADGANPVLRIRQTPTSNGYGFTLTGVTATHAHIKAPKYTSGNGFILEFVTTAGYSGFVNGAIGCPATFENLTFSAPGTRAQSLGSASIVGSTYSMTADKVTRYIGCLLEWPGQQNATLQMGNGGYNFRCELIDCEIKANDAAAAATSLVAIHNNNTHRLVLDSCKFTGFVPGSRLIASATAATGNDTLFVRNCDFGNVNVLGPNLLTSPIGEFDAGMCGFFATSQYGTRDFVYERAGRLYAEWNYSKGRPYLNARLNDGTTPWSIFAVTANTALCVSKLCPVELPRISKIIPENVDLAEGVRTLTLNFLLESNLAAWTKQDISVLVEYQAPDGTVETLNSYDSNAGALSTSGASWSATSWNAQTWLPKTFSVVTPTSVKAGSEISIYVRLHSTVTNETWGVIIDPEIIVT